MKPTVILFSHGSLLCGAGEQLELHAQRLRSGGEYSRVEVGYLNYSSPTFGEAVEKCRSAGAKHILIAPYFLVPGYFVKVGLPRVLAPERERFPDLGFQIAPALGDHPLLADAVIACAARAQPPENWRTILHSAPQFCEQDDDCPLYKKCRSENFEIRDSESGAQNNSSFIVENSSLLLMVHGSPNEASNAPVVRVAEMIREKQEYSRVAVGFMECNAPSIPDAIEELIQSGARHIVATPYFLHAGTHVADDLPSLLEAAQEKYSDVEFLLGDYLGREALISEVLCARLLEAQPVP
jgi:sirohydrochlorin cobaltochelatase